MRRTFATVIHVLVMIVAGGISTRYFYPSWPFSALYSLQLHLSLGATLAVGIAVASNPEPFGRMLLCLTLALVIHGVILSQNYVSAVSEKYYEIQPTTLRLLSFNVFSSNQVSSHDIARAIIDTKADLVNIMEAAPVKGAIEELEKIYPYRIGCGAMTPQCDQVMLSKVPLEEPEVRTLSGIFPQRFMSAKVTFAGRSFNLVGIHTTKPYFDNFQHQELIRSAELINRLEGPVVLSGDFNASTISPTMQDFLKNTELRHWNWEPATWPIFAGRLGVAIDHVYTRGSLELISLSRLPRAYGSNHYGLVAEIRFPTSH